LAPAARQRSRSRGIVRAVSAILRSELDGVGEQEVGLAQMLLGELERGYVAEHPADVYGPEFPGETFRVLKEKETRQQQIVMPTFSQLLKRVSVTRCVALVGEPGAGKTTTLDRLALELAQRAFASSEAPHRVEIAPLDVARIHECIGSYFEVAEDGDELFWSLAGGQTKIAWEWYYWVGKGRYRMG
jgi:hypothetical protein